MTLQTRIRLFTRLGEYILEDSADWQDCKARAYRENPWFITEFIELSVKKIAEQFLQEKLLSDWAMSYSVQDSPNRPKNIGIVMAGNIPLVGFHDLLCSFISGHKTTAKAASKDTILVKHLVNKLAEWNPLVLDQIVFADHLKGCDAYIATGSNNTSRYFEYYFGKYPHIIRKNRSSVAILDGSETPSELLALADDIQFYFGLGCRNVTKIFVPNGYDFIPLLDALRKYAHFMDFHKYKHNYDYHLAILMMSNRYYMNNESLILTENIAVFSPVSQVHYAFYSDAGNVLNELSNNEEVQCMVGHGLVPFGMAQSPSLTDYADGIDTMSFLTNL